MPRPIPLLALALVFGALAAVVHDAPQEERLADIADRLEERVQLIQEVLRGQVDTLTNLVHDRSCQSLSTGDFLSEEIRSERGDRGIEFSIFCGGQLVAWTGNAPVTIIDSVATAPVIRNTNGCWLHASTRSGMRVGVHALCELWTQPPFENRYLHRHFNPRLGVEQGVEASMEAGLGPVVHDRKGDVLFRLQWQGDIAPPGKGAKWRLALALFGSACAIAALWSWLVPVARTRPWLAIAIMIAAPGLVRCLMLAMGPWSWLGSFSLFDPDLFAASVVLPSFGDLLITIGLLLVVCAFIKRALRDAPAPGRATIDVVISLTLLLLFSAWINGTLIALVRDSRIPLDLFHPQTLDDTSIIAFMAIAFLLFAWMLFADGLVRWLTPTLHARPAAFLAAGMFAAAHVIYHFLGVFDSMLVLWPLPLLIALFLARRDGVHLTGALVMVATLSLFTVHVLNRQNFKRMERDRAALAESAGTQEDPVVEWLFREVRVAITSDAAAVALLNGNDAVTAADLDARLRQPFFQGAWNNYDVRLHLFGANGSLRGSNASGGPPTLGELRTRFEQGIPVEEDNMLRNVHRPTESALYIGAIGTTASENGGRLVVELLPRVLPEGLGFPELLMASDRAVDRRTDRYPRARYERGVLVESSGGFAFPTRWNIRTGPDGMLLEQSGFTLFATGDPASTVVVIASARPGWLDHLTTFSYLFIFFALFFAAYFLLRSWNTGQERQLFSLSAKLRLGIILLTCIAILCFAYGALRLLRNDLAERSEKQLDERSRSAIADLRQHVHLEEHILPAMYPDLDHWVDKASEVLLTDITAYTPEGELMATSREQVFNNGLLGARMDPEAYVAMAVHHRSMFTHAERIGAAVFLTAYRPLLNDHGDVLAYLAVPYFARQSEVEDARTAGYVAIVNLSVLLFLLSIAVAALIATWTTRPLQLLKRGLERIQLGARNEPIPYQGADELGELVRVYNRKVEELRESAEKLARSERESAWKEMAQQVAHEIKNPLTPMKLGIQHFQQTWDPKAPEAKERLDRFTTSMSEQIDALSRVAGDFSRFAQMSAANETMLDLNEVARSAVALFAGEPNADITLTTASPLMVKADREHLLRVFNNLIKNALQSIPEGRRSKIDVTMKAENDQAIAEVRDNGSGIPEEIRDHIFEPNFTTKGSGMGLGLAMVKRMVEQASGRVWFETRTGGGTSFFIAIPLPHG